MPARTSFAALLWGVLIPALSGALPPAAGPSFDCARARSRDEKFVCDTPELSALDRRMVDALAAALAGASPAEREKLRRDQSEWLRLRSGCAGQGSAAPPERGAVTTCMRLLYARRLPELTAAAPPPRDAIGARSIKWADERRHVEVDVAYPSLAARTRGAAAFNAFFERQARRWEARARAIAGEPQGSTLAKGNGKPRVMDVSFEIALATERTVTVVSSGYELRADHLHPLRFRTSTTFDLDLGRPLGEADLFVRGGKEGAVALVLEKLRGPGDDEEQRLADGKKAASDLSNWTFGADAVEVTFPVHSAGAYAEGETKVSLGYGELRGFLRPDAAVLRR